MRSVLALLLVLAATATAGSITTGFDGGNSYNGNMFDVAVGPKNLLITGFDVNVDPVLVTINVYTREGSYLGYETNPADWTLRSSSTVTGNGEDNPTHFDLATPFLLTAGGSYGFYVTIFDQLDSYMYYTDGSGTYSNADVQLDLGIGVGGLFSQVFEPRIWNGTMYYETSDVPEPASCLLVVAGLGGLGLLRRKLA